MKKLTLLFALALILTACGGGSEEPVEEPKETTEEQTEETTEQAEAPVEEPVEEEKEEPAAEETKEEPAPAPEPAPEEPEEDVPQEYKNALKKGETYANMMNMSKAGVYEQLTSEYGEGFPPEAAEWAVNELDKTADWNENALKKAETYYKDMAMSKDAVFEQLVSEYGEQFTEEQARYAVDNLD